jgi:hypothetical protein
MSKLQNNCLLQTDGEQLYYLCSGARKNQGCHFFNETTKAFGHCCTKSQLNIQNNVWLCTSTKAIKHLKDSFFNSYITRFTPITIQKGD